MNDLSEGRVGPFEEIARSENKVERHIRHLAPLSFVSPRIIEAIANGSTPTDLTVTMLQCKSTICGGKAIAKDRTPHSSNIELSRAGPFSASAQSLNWS